MCLAPRFLPARVGTSATLKPAFLRRRVKAGLGVEDQTEKTPSGVSARKAALRPSAE